MDAITVLVVPDDMTEEPRVVEVKPDDLTAMQTLVGGPLEAVHGANGYCNEEGKNMGLPINLRATSLAWALGWRVGDYLVGPVVFCGPPRGGWDTSVPDEVLAVMG